MTLRKITVCVRENSSPLPPVSPWPLLYALEVSDPYDESAILRQIADIRVDELGLPDENDGVQNGKVYEILDGLELLFCFDGDVAPLIDWRE